jgi:putative (di)nucleoside polyphosphate hydrolase
MTKNRNNIPPDYLYRNGVGIMIINKEKKVFVGKRIDNKDNFNEAWQMPQGGIDLGEDEELAMFRELKEETGIEKKDVEIIYKLPKYQYYNLPKLLQKRLWGGRYLGQKQRWFLLQFKADDSFINIKTENPEFIDWKWVREEELINLIVGFKRELYGEIVKGFRKFLVK